MSKSYRTHVRNAYKLYWHQMGLGKYPYRDHTDTDRYVALLASGIPVGVARRVHTLMTQHYQGHADVNYAKRNDHWKVQARRVQRDLIKQERFDELAPRPERLVPYWGW